MTEIPVENEKQIRFVPLYSGGALYLVNHCQPVILDLEGLEKLPDCGIPCLFEHQDGQRVGTLEEIRKEEMDGHPCICAYGSFLPGQWAWNVRNLARQGFRWEGSIKTQPPSRLNVEVVPPGAIAHVNGRNFVGPAKIFRRWAMKEGSFVFYGGDPYNAAEVTAHGAGPSHFRIEREEMPTEIRDYILSLGVNPDEVTPEQATVYERCYKALKDGAPAGADGEMPDDKKKEDAPAGAEGEMSDDKKKDGAPAGAEGEMSDDKKKEDAPAGAEGGMPDDKKKEDAPACADGDMSEDFKAFLLSVGVTQDELAAGLDPAALDAYSRAFLASGKSEPAAGSGSFRNGKNPAVYLPRGRRPNTSPQRPNVNEILTASLLGIAGGFASDEAVAASGKFSQNVMNEAVSAQWRNVGLRDVFASAYEQRVGVRLRSSIPGDFAHRCFRIMDEDGSAGASGSFSTIRPLTILNNCVSILYLDGFEKFNGIARKICGVNYNDNLQKAKLTYYDISGSLDLIPQGDEIPNVTLHDTEFETQVFTFAMLLTLTEDMILNDRLDAFMKLPRKMGVKNARFREMKVVKTLSDSLATFCTTGRGNKITKKFGTAGIDLAAEALAGMETVGSTASVPEFTEAEGKFVLVPRALYQDARTLYTASKCDLVGLTPGQLESNPYVGLYEPVTSNYWGSRGFGANDDRWGMFADPNETAAIYLSFLRGEEKPRIEEFPTPSNILGRTWRCADRFGVDMGDHRAFVYSDGSAN